MLSASPHAEHEGNWYILVCGLELQESAHALGGGLSLRKLDAPLTVFDLAAAGAAGFREWAVLEPHSWSASCEIESPKDSDVTPGYDALNRAWLVSALLRLKGFARHICPATSAYSWNIIAGHQERTKHLFHEQLKEEGVGAAVYHSRRDLPPFKGGLLDYQLSLFIESDARTDGLTGQDVAWIREHFGDCNRMAAEDVPFRFALEAAVDWRFAKDARASVARIWSGIEAIFGIHTELAYRVSLMAASLLEPRGKSRKERFNEIRRRYDRRSKAVHGSPVEPDALITTVNDSYRLLRSLLLIAIERGKPLSETDFDRAVFW